MRRAKAKITYGSHPFIGTNEHALRFRGRVVFRTPAEDKYNPQEPPAWMLTAKEELERWQPTNNDIAYLIASECKLRLWKPRPIDQADIDRFTAMAVAEKLQETWSVS